MNEWFDLSKEQPAIDEMVITWDGENVDIARLLYDEPYEWRDKCYYEVQNVTHWMSLPEPPKDKCERVD